MQRVIEFRGMAITKEGYTPGRVNWVIGDLLHEGDQRTFIRWKNPEDLPPRYIDYLVDPETVGQFTGWWDRDGRMIFEGDIVERYWNSHYGNVSGPVVFLRDQGFVALMDLNGHTGFAPLKDVRIIGNIHEKQIAKG